MNDGHPLTRPVTRASLGLGTAALVADNSLLHVAGTETKTGDLYLVRSDAAATTLKIYGLGTQQQAVSIGASDTRRWTFVRDSSDFFALYQDNTFWAGPAGYLMTVRPSGEFAFGVAGAPTAGNGLLQRAAGTTKANGDAYGNDTWWFRKAGGYLTAQGNDCTIGVTDGSGAYSGTMRRKDADGYIEFNADQGIGFRWLFGAGVMAEIDSAGTLRSFAKVEAYDQFKVNQFKTPASSAASGVAGSVCWDTNYIYVATGTNAWKRVALATW